jgi:hypothetical protein
MEIAGVTLSVTTVAQTGQADELGVGVGWRVHAVGGCLSGLWVRTKKKWKRPLPRRWRMLQYFQGALLLWLGRRNKWRRKKGLHCRGSQGSSSCSTTRGATQRLSARMHRTFETR